MPTRSEFRAELERLQGARRRPTPKRWVYAAYDQLTDRVGPLSESVSEVGLVLVEAPAKAARRPYHRKKLAFVLAAGRRFALEQAARGRAVRHVVARAGEGFREPLARLASELGALTLMEPAERELRAELAPLVQSGALVSVPNAGWLTTPEDFTRAAGAAPPWRMDRFYRGVRRRTGLLMEPDGQPIGGKWSFDAENREPWRGTPPAPRPPSFRHGALEREVEALVAERYADHPGDADLSGLATTRAGAQRVWRWFLAECLPHFGRFEDAMSAREVGLFHARIATYLNVQLLGADEVVQDVAAADAPLAAREGFVRQVLGWREFVRHVHAATDGLRTLPERAALGPGAPLPPVFWDAEGSASGLACLDTVVARVWSEGYSHHIERLMVLSNLATLLDLSPRELTDWFWVAYTDAYDWVVEPNVLGMGTYALGEAMTTKPYVSGAAYLAKMGDFCKECRFDPKKDCPITELYWAFLERHRARLAGNVRMALPLKSSSKRPAARRAVDQRVFEHVRERLAAGGAVTPAELREARR